MKLGVHACYIISMTTSCFHDDYILFEQHQIASATLHSSNLLMVEIKLGTHAYYTISMTTTVISSIIVGSHLFTEIYVVVYKNE